MSVNNLSYEDVGSILIATYYYATGMNSADLPEPSDLDLSTFTSIATKTLAFGTERVMNALSQVLSKTIFSERPYDAKFKSLELDSIEWGNIVRKINFADGGDYSPELTYDPDAGEGDYSFDRALTPNDMGSGEMSPWFGKDAAVVQTNFYGTAAAADSYQIREEALKGAFRGPEELAAFISSLMTFINNRHEQFIETLARGALSNYILGKAATAAYENVAYSGEYAFKTHVVHLLTEYNEATGLSLTSQTVYQPVNFKPFMEWVYGRVASISDMMTERTNAFHTDLCKKNDMNDRLFVLRHTPKRAQRVILYSPIQHMTASRALADTYHDSYLRYPEVELVNYFGNVKDPQTVTGGYSYLNPMGDGDIIEGPYEFDDDDTLTSVSNIFGLILDRNAVGYMRQSTRILTSPFNPATQSYTIWWHLAGKWVNDFSENGCLLLLD